MSSQLCYDEAWTVLLDAGEEEGQGIQGGGRKQ